MAVFKCKMCGGDLEIQEGLTICECEYCGTKQTIPALDNEKKLNLFNRANRLRFNSEFDKAASIYENIIAEFPEEAEGYWGLVLCNYGIEYVDDPATARKIPTCHRAAFESVTKDENYKLALEYADVVAQKVYRDEAREIDRIMSEILSISKNEEPYDVFICYKETDDVGGRTIDSVIAQDVYDALTDKGYRVFFSRISLEDKLGQQYEPYIFAALNSAKVMLAFGTKYEYFHAVWVKNEWSRFLKLMAKDKTKALIPCYKDMDPYDMPDEFKALQAQDMGKVGAVQDLVRGVDKLLSKKKDVTKNSTPVDNSAKEAAKQIKVAKVSLETHKWQEALLCLRNAMKINPDCADIYLYLLLAKNKIESVEKLEKSKKIIFDSDGDYARYVKLSGNNPEIKIDKKKFSKKWKYGFLTFFSIFSMFWGFVLLGALATYKILALTDTYVENSFFTQYAFALTLPVVLICFTSAIISLVFTKMKKKSLFPSVALLVSILTFFLSFFVFVNAEGKWAFDAISKKTVQLCENGDYDSAIDLYFLSVYGEKYDYYSWRRTVTEDLVSIFDFYSEYLSEDISEFEKNAQGVVEKAVQDYVDKDDYKGIIRLYIKKFDTGLRINYSKNIKINVPKTDYKLYIEAIDFYNETVVSKLQENGVYWGHDTDVVVRYNLVHQLPKGVMNTKAIDTLYKFYETDYSERKVADFKACFDNAEVKCIATSDDYICSFMLGKWSNGSSYIKYYEKNDGIYFENSLPTPNVYDAAYYDVVDRVHIWENSDSEKVADVFKYSFIDADTLECYCYANNRTYTLYR